MIFVGRLEPQLYITQRVVFTIRPLAQLSHFILFSLVCAINIIHISSHKMIFVGLEPQWYNTQRVVFTTRPLARCWKPTATY
jgi:hypothetical protein